CTKRGDPEHYGLDLEPWVKWLALRVPQSLLYKNDSGRDRRALRLGNDLLRFHPGKNRRVPCGIGMQRERNRLIEIQIHPASLSRAQTLGVRVMQTSETWRGGQKNTC